VLKQAEEKQLEQDIEDAFAMGDLDDEDIDPANPYVSTQDLLQQQEELLWPQRIKRLLARDSYYTAEEAKAGDPRVVEDPADQTTDSEAELGDSWDEDDDEDFDPDVEMEDIEMVQRDHHMSPSR
jgi:hypothetical protein